MKNQNNTTSHFANFFLEKQWWRNFTSYCNGSVYIPDIGTISTVFNYSSDLAPIIRAEDTLADYNKEYNGGDNNIARTIEALLTRKIDNTFEYNARPQITWGFADEEYYNAVGGTAFPNSLKDSVYKSLAEIEKISSITFKECEPTPDSHPLIRLTQHIRGPFTLGGFASGFKTVPQSNGITTVARELAVSTFFPWSLDTTNKLVFPFYSIQNEYMRNLKDHIIPHEWGHAGLWLEHTHPTFTQSASVMSYIGSYCPNGIFSAKNAETILSYFTYTARQKPSNETEPSYFAPLDVINVKAVSGHGPLPSTNLTDKDFPCDKVLDSRNLLAGWYNLNTAAAQIPLGIGFAVASAFFQRYLPELAERVTLKREDGASWEDAFKKGALDSLVGLSRTGLPVAAFTHDITASTIKASAEYGIYTGAKAFLGSTIENTAHYIMIRITVGSPFFYGMYVFSESQYHKSDNSSEKSSIITKLKNTVKERLNYLATLPENLRNTTTTDVVQALKGVGTVTIKNILGPLFTARGIKHFVPDNFYHFFKPEKEEDTQATATVGTAATISHDAADPFQLTEIVVEQTEDQSQANAPVEAITPTQSHQQEEIVIGNNEPPSSTVNIKQVFRFNSAPLATIHTYDKNNDGPGNNTVQTYLDARLGSRSAPTILQK